MSREPGFNAPSLPWASHGVVDTLFPIGKDRVVHKRGQKRLFAAYKRQLSQSPLRVGRGPWPRVSRPWDIRTCECLKLPEILPEWKQINLEQTLISIIRFPFTILRRIKTSPSWFSVSSLGSFKIDLIGIGSCLSSPCGERTTVTKRHINALFMLSTWVSWARLLKTSLD
jgi:hypothetical protein